jgi:hypothetical protein
VLRDGPIPKFAHGVLDYALGIFLIAGPFLLNFNKPSATLVSIIIGALVLVFTATSNLPTGLRKRIPEPAHVIGDLGLSVLLMAAPFMFGFNEAAKPTITFLALGAAHLLITLGTRFRAAPAG